MLEAKDLTLFVQFEYLIPVNIKDAVAAAVRDKKAKTAAKMKIKRVAAAGKRKRTVETETAMAATMLQLVAKKEVEFYLFFIFV